MGWYRKTTPSSYPATPASNFTDSTKNWRQYKNIYRRTTDLETASLTAVPGRYTDSTRTWRRIRAIYRFTSSGTWQKVFGKFAGQPYAEIAAAIRYNSYDGIDVGDFAMMGPGSESIAQGSTSTTYLWGKDGQNWQNIETLASRTRTFIYNSIPIADSASLVTNDEGNFDGDKLRNTEAVISQYDGQYLWYRDRITLANGSTGTSYSQTVKIIKQQPVINSLSFKTNNTVSAGSTKYITYSVANQWYRSIDRYNSILKWYILDSQYETPTEAKLLGSTTIFYTSQLVDNSTTLSGEDYFSIPTTFGGASTTSKWLHVKLICKNSSSDTDVDYTVAPYNDVTEYIVAQIGAADATAPTSVNATATTTYFDVSWSGQTNATIYRVFWSGSSSTTADPSVSYDYETSSATWRWGTSNPDRNGLTPSTGSSYYFYVSASSGNGVWTPYVRSTTSYSLAVTNATAPTSVTASANATTITINWSGATNAVKYRIYWTPSSTTTADPSTTYDEEKGNVSTWIWNSSDPDRYGAVPSSGNLYYFYVSASNTNDVWSSWTRSTSAVSLVLPPVNQSAPTISGGTRSFTLTSNGAWNPDDADGVYEYQWKYNDQGALYLNVPASYSTSGSSTGSSLNLNTSALDGLGIRCYVTATNAGGSATANSNTILASAPVLAPTNSTIPTLSPSSISVGTLLTAGRGTWNNFPTSYDVRIYRGTQFVSTGETLVASGTGTSVTYTVTQADYDSGQRYFRTYVNATNSGGSSGFVAGEERGPIATPGVAPSGGTATVTPSTANAGTSFSGSTSGWSGTATITYSYSWQYFSSSSFSWVQIASGTTWNSPSNFNTLYPNYGTRLVVTATNSYGSATATTSFTVNTPVSGTAPSTPSGLTNSYSSGPTWTGSWSASTGTATITYYWTLRQSLTNGGAVTNTASGSTTGTSFTQSMNSTYGLWAYFTVYASNAYGTSGTATSSWA